MQSVEPLVLHVVYSTGIGAIRALVDLARRPENRQKALFALWVISVLFLLIVTSSLIFIVFYFASSNKPGIFLSAIVWSFFFGICVLFFLPSKAVTTLFGSLLGISVNEASTATGLLTKSNEAITNLANQIGIIIKGQGQTTDPFIGWVIWIFILILALICLPAFFRD